MYFVWLPKSTVMTPIVSRIKSWFFKINREILVQKFMKIILCKVKKSFSLNWELFRNSFSVKNCFLSHTKIAEVKASESPLKIPSRFFFAARAFFLDRVWDFFLCFSTR